MFTLATALPAANQSKNHPQDTSMKLFNMTQIGLLTAIVLGLCSFGATAEESHTALALKHAEVAAKATDGKTIAEHAETARTHAKVSEEHVANGIKKLDEAIEQGKLGHTEPAKKAAEEAVTHLKKAQ